MSDETWNITMGARSFEIPCLPLRVTRVVYPICQRLSNASLALRLVAPTEPLAISEAEMDDLVRIAYLACSAADPELTEEIFNELPIVPPQLYDAFFTIRKACGGWSVIPEGKEVSGEEEPPQT